VIGKVDLLNLLYVGIIKWIYYIMASLLGSTSIRKFLSTGEIIIEPFNKNNLNTNSYDVTLGKYYYREQKKTVIDSDIYNLYSKDQVNRIWGKAIEALPYSYYKERGITFENIRDDELIIFIKAGESILAHTNEFIGGVSHVTTMMKSRSSLGRNFISTCMDAGLGDVGYYSRWTMEITNRSTQYTIPLVVGRRIAQIVFFDVGTIENIQSRYNNTGKYQTEIDMESLKNNWKPNDMLPKLYNDWEITNKN
jgi:dCTP deaminase